MKGVLAMPLSMTLEPVQKQQLTQHLIQQMNLLQMTSEELDAFVAREVEQNPLLERRTGMAPHAPKGARSQR